jgi:hypothetical protein
MRRFSRLSRATKTGPGVIGCDGFLVISMSLAYCST